MNIPGMAIPPAFHRALTRFRNSLSNEEKNTFSHLTSEKEVWNLVEELQKEQGSRTALRNMRRVEPFINGMAQYASVIEVFVQLKPEIMALVWGPLKLLLQLAGRFVESFDRILDAIERIGENLPRFRRFGAIFSYSDQIQHVISLIYEDILDFYRRALKFFRRRAWKIVFSLTWDSFENRFGLILNNLQRHQSLVDNEARAEDIEQAHNARQGALKQFEAFQERDRNDRMMTMFNWLNPANIEADKDKVASKKSPGTGNWLLETKEMKDWIQGKGKFIWLTGKPGSGKTVLSFSILEHLEMKKKSKKSSQPILYFFCGYSQAHRNTSLAILRTFIYQIVNQDNDLLPYVYREWLNDHHSHSSVSKLKNLLCNLLEASVTISENVYIIVDGLDELPDTERQNFLHVLKPLKSKAPYNSIARVFVASRNLSDIRTGLSTPKATEISIEGNNTDDIHEYIDCESQRVGERLGLEAEMRELIAVSLRTRADGMFLWVHLIIESLLTQTTIKGIRETLGNLPKGLDQAYERILLRIKSLPLHAQEQANKILEWLTCGSRILKISELEDAFAINSGDSTVDGESRPFRDSFKSLCGPIIELTDQDTIVFVHFSAKEYLLSRFSGPFIHRRAAHLKISLVCITYQCFQCFEPALSNDMAAESVLNGDLRLFDYVQSSWLEHIREFCRLCPDKSQLERLSVTLRDLFKKRNSLLRPNFLSPRANGPNSHQTFPSENLAQIQDFNCLESDLKTELMKVLEYDEALKRKLSILGTRDELISWCNENNPLTMDRSGRVLQQVLEDLLHGTSTEPPVPANIEKLQKFYGTSLYKCRYQSCWMSSGEGFTTLARRQSHEEKHVRPYRCQEQGCIYGDRGFTSKNYLRKHVKDYHTVSAIGKLSARAIEDLRQPLIDSIEGNENQSIFTLINPKSTSAGASGSISNSGNSIIEDLSLELFELTNQLSEKTELLDRVLASKAPPLFSDPNKSSSLVMSEIQATIDSCVDRFLDPGIIANLEDADVLQIEIMLRQLSSQLKSWKKLVQSFHIVSQSSRATEQLVFNILHCREQYLDDFETPKGRYTTTVSMLEKTRDRLVQCYFYIQNVVQSEDRQASLLDDISNQRVRVSQKAQQEIPQQPQLVPQSPQTPEVSREIPMQQSHLPKKQSDQLTNISDPYLKRILEDVDDAILTTSQALRLLMVNGIDPTQLTLHQLAAFQNQRPATQTKTLQYYLQNHYLSGTAENFLESLREAEIDPSLLTPSELLIFEPKAQGQTDDHLHTSKLLLANGVNPNRLLVGAFAAFQDQSPVAKVKTLRSYHHSLKTHWARTAAAIPMVQTEKVIGSDQSAPQQPTALPSQDLWGTAKLLAFVPQSPEPSTQSTIYYTSSQDLALPLGEIDRSHLEPPNEVVPRFNDFFNDSSQYVTDRKPNIFTDTFPEKNIYTPHGDPEYTEGNWEVQHHDPGAQPYSNLPDPSPWDPSGIPVQNRGYHGVAREQSEQLPPLYHHTTHSIPPASQRSSEAMLGVDGPEDDPFYGLEDELFGPRN